MEHKDIPIQCEQNPTPSVHVAGYIKRFIRESLGMDPYKSTIAFHGNNVWVWNSRRVERFATKEASEATA